MIIIAKTLGGSRGYSLDTPTSDFDYRGIFCNTEVKDIIGLGRHEHQQNQGNGKDEVFTEFRNALKLLRSGNTQMIELLYTDEWIEISDTWRLVIEQRQKLVSSEKLFSCLRGYMQGELSLTLGERTGRLGGKRFEQVQTYGFSPKNAVQLIRLAWAGDIYFQKGYFPVNVRKESEAMADELLRIKTSPGLYSKERVKELAHGWEKVLVNSFESRKITTFFDENLANELCLEVYGRKVVEFYNQRRRDNT
jgi:predicted nucleotidyltransferase